MAVRIPKKPVPKNRVRRRNLDRLHSVWRVGSVDLLGRVSTKAIGIERRKLNVSAQKRILKGNAIMDSSGNLYKSGRIDRRRKNKVLKVNETRQQEIRQVQQKLSARNEAITSFRQAEETANRIQLLNSIISLEEQLNVPENLRYCPSVNELKGMPSELINYFKGLRTRYN